MYRSTCSKIQFLVKKICAKTTVHVAYWKLEKNTQCGLNTDLKLYKTFTLLSWIFLRF